MCQNISYLNELNHKHVHYVTSAYNLLRYEYHNTCMFVCDISMDDMEICTDAMLIVIKLLNSYIYVSMNCFSYLCSHAL